jgi:hypothetical protein
MNSRIRIATRHDALIEKRDRVIADDELRITPPGMHDLPVSFHPHGPV